MHIEAMDFLRKVRPLLPEMPRVADLGGRNVNGSARDLFPVATHYLAVDRMEGDGVDVVADAATWHLGPRFLFDVVVCTETLEHAENAAAICANAYRLLRDGGIFLLTAANMGRGEHSAVDGGVLRAGEFYKNVSATLLREWLASFPVVLIQERGDIDIYALAIK